MRCEPTSSSSMVALTTGPPGIRPFQHLHPYPLWGSCANFVDYPRAADASEKKKTCRRVITPPPPPYVPCDVGACSPPPPAAPTLMPRLPPLPAPTVCNITLSSQDRSTVLPPPSTPSTWYEPRRWTGARRWCDLRGVSSPFPLRAPCFGGRGDGIECCGGGKGRGSIGRCVHAQVCQDCTHWGVVLFPPYLC